MKKRLLALGIAAVLGANIAGTSAVWAADKVEITNVSYDPTDPYCVDVRCISGTSGDQYDHAELPGILGHHGSFVHYLLFQKISKSKKRTGVRL